MSAPAVSIEFAQRFHALRRRHLAVRLATAVAGAATALLAFWIALAVTDYYWEWPLAWRKIAWIAAIAIVAACFLARLCVIVRETRQRSFAGQLEDAFEEFGQRIRTVLDAVDGRIHGPVAMLSALGHQTLGRWETSTPGRIVPLQRLMACGVLCLIVSGLTAGMFGAGDDWRRAMLRAIGSDRPYTTMAVTPGNTKVLEGAPVEVALELQGRTDRDVVLRYRYLSSDEPDPSSDEAWIESELFADEPEEGVRPNRRFARFPTQLGKANEPVEYQFVTSIGTTDFFRIDVQPLIEVQRIDTQVDPPGYSGLESRSFASADVTVLEQSLVNVTIQTNHPLGEALLKRGAKRSQMEAVPVEPGEGPGLWTFQLPSTDSLYWEFSGSGRDGTPMTPVQGRLRVRRDAAPRLVWRDPPDAIRVHTLAELPMRLQVSDDYGISEAAIVFQLGGEDEYVLADWSDEHAEGRSTSNTTRLQLEETLPLESFALSERDYISYYAYAIDNREPAPHRGESEIRYIDIRPLRQYYGEIEAGPNDGTGGVLVQLDEIIRRQRFMINRTRTLVRSSPSDLTAHIGTIDRLVESQSELAGLTRFLAEFFVSRGNDDVEALSQAEAAMLQAADSLAAGSFDLAFAQEEDALRALAEARRTLEIFLIKNMTPQQRQELRRLARQLRQKLRRDRPETEQQLADSLQRIAQQQSQLGDRAARFLEPPPNPQPAADGGESAGGPQTAPLGGTSDGQVSQDEPLQDEQDSQSGDGSTEAESTSELAREEQQEQLFAEQIELLERVQAIEDQLTERLSESALMSQRMEAVQTAMNDLAIAAREAQLERFSSASRDVSEQLRELGLQLDALAATEPVTRVSALRDLTTSLANMESELAEQLLASGRQQGEPSGEAEGTEETGAPADAVQRRARRMQRRTETIEDVLDAPVEVGDVETSEVNDRLRTFAEENRYREQLESTRAASETVLSEQPLESVSASDDARRRSVEYADAALQLDDLYRELVTPRLERLRELEARATQLAGQMAAGKERGKNEPDPEVKAGIAALQQDLKEEGFGDLAEELDLEARAEEDTQDPIEMAGDGRPDGHFDPSARRSPAGRALLVVEELRARIQEMILLEISADRDAPIPPQYRTAVDQYLRAIAGDAESISGGAMQPNEGGDN